MKGLRSNTVNVQLMMWIVVVWICLQEDLCSSQTVHSEGGLQLPLPYSSSSNTSRPRLIPHSHLILNSRTLEVPQIHSPQTKLTVQVGDKVHLPCKVYNLGEDQVLWKQGTNILAGSNISTYSDHRIEMTGDFTLVISNVSRFDEGSYECLVTSQPPVSIVHSVSVLDPPTITLLTPTNIIITEGDSVEIGCTPHGNPPPKVSWSMRDGNIPLALHKALALNQSRLQLANVTRAYTGLWVCTADNGVGRPAIGAVYVRVLYSPEIEIPRRRVHGGVGFRSELVVALVHADPKPEIRWKKEGELITNSDRVYMELFGRNEYRLIFDEVKASDFAMYSIEANNSLGLDLKHIEFLGVPNQPVLTRWESEDIEGIQTTLYWGVECYSSLIEYRLFFRQAGIPPSKEIQEGDPGLIKLNIPADKLSFDAKSFIHTQSFALRGLNQSSIYEAAVQARNKYGWSLLSSICYFATYPNSSSSTKSKEMEEAMSKIKSAYHDGFPRYRPKPAWTQSSTNMLSPCLSMLLALPILLVLIKR